MSKVRLLAVLVACLLFFMVKAHADTIYLKNGKSLQGLVNKDDEGVVEVNVGNGVVVFQANEIKRIQRSTPREIEEIKKNWEMNKIQIEKTRERDREEKEKAAEKWEAMVTEEIHQGAERRYMDENTKIVPVTSDRGHVVVNAVLNESVHASFIIDTGCPMVLLTSHVAQKLGIDLAKAPAAPEVMVLNGKHKVRQLLLKSVKLGEVEAKNVEAEVMLDDTLEMRKQIKDGLLGMSFIKRFDVTLDHKKMRLIIKPRL